MTKSKIYAGFPEFSRDIKKLAEVRSSISEKQFTALLETISGAGYSVFTTPEKQRYLILANPEDHPGFKYQLPAFSTPKKVPDEGIVLPDFIQQTNAVIWTFLVCLIKRSIKHICNKTKSIFLSDKAFPP